VPSATPSTAAAQAAQPVHLVATTPLETAFRLQAAQPMRDAIFRAQSLKQTADAEAFHKLRIALRRLRSLWWAYQPVLDKRDAKSRSEEFKVLADAAGKTRDWDVLRELLVERKDIRQTFQALVPPIDAFRAHALSYSSAAIGNANVEAILSEALQQALQQLSAHDAQPPLLGEFALTRIDSAQRKLRRRVKQATQSEHDDYAMLHQIRIAGKRMRYLLEFFAPVLNDTHQVLVRKLASIQKELGDLNDLVTSETLIRQYPFPPEMHDLVADLKRWLQREKRLSRDNAYTHLRDL